ncbi:MAG TPA: integrase arm-type DNA-binding domain-containing protein [Alicycliphilus sp.]|nr:integrase arm-type DNA-binding domain-containing protein [Alicycliphilus sp.]
MPRRATPLTDTAVRNAKPDSSKPKGHTLPDGSGLYLHVTQAGKYWRMDYRRPNGKRNTLAFGVYPAVGLAQARQQRDQARELLAQGIDPSDHKRRTKEDKAAAMVNTVEAMARAYLENKREGWSPTHYNREARSLEKDLYPYLGQRPIGEVEPPDLLKACERVQARDAVESAHRLLTTASGVWQFAIAKGHATRDIAQDIKKALKPRKKGHFPAITSPAQLGELLRASDGYGGGPVVRAALAIAPMLFQRPGNLRAMRWADLNLDAGWWTIPSADMKRSLAAKRDGAAHKVPLPRQAVAAILKLQPLTGHGEYVFPGLRDRSKPMSEAAVNAALHAMGYKDVHTWHGYRATGRTLLREVFKIDIDVIEAQLAHVGGKTHGGAYDRTTFADERVTVLQQWADYLDKLRQGADVIPLHQRSA